MKMRKHDFMGEERDPFKCSSPITVRTANEFVLAVGELDEFGVTKLPNRFGAIAYWNQIFKFHTPQLYGRGLDIGSPCE